MERDTMGRDVMGAEMGVWMSTAMGVSIGAVKDSAMDVATGAVIGDVAIGAAVADSSSDNETGSLVEIGGDIYVFRYIFKYLASIIYVV